MAVEFAGVNYTDVRNRMGHGLGSPFVPGVEVSGTVREVGSGVTTLARASRSRPSPGDTATPRWRWPGDLHRAAARQPGQRPESAGMLVTVPVVLMLLRRVARVRPASWSCCTARRAGSAPSPGSWPRGSGCARCRHRRRRGQGRVRTPARLRGGLRLRRLRRAGARVAPGGVDVMLDPVGGDLRARSFALLATFGRLSQLQQHLGRAGVAPDAEWMRARCVGYLGFSAGQLSASHPSCCGRRWRRRSAWSPPGRRSGRQRGLPGKGGGGRTSPVRGQGGARKARARAVSVGGGGGGHRASTGVPRTRERAWAVGPGERSVRGLLGHVNIWASTVSRSAGSRHADWPCPHYYRRPGAFRATHARWPAGDRRVTDKLP